MGRKLSWVLLVGLSVGAAGQQQPVDVTEDFAQLAEQPATHTGFVFDRSALELARGLLTGAGMDGDRAAAALRSVSLDTYKYAQAAFYSPEAMAGLVAAYHAAGWKHLVNQNATAGNSAQPKTTVTDMWLHFHGADIDAVTVVARTTRQMTVMKITGDLRPLDLLHLSGHLGIPKVDQSAVMVPDGK